LRSFTDVAAFRHGVVGQVRHIAFKGFNVLVRPAYSSDMGYSTLQIASEAFGKRAE
jgi:hypothetical protein